jgi:hypothetical protein
MKIGAINLRLMIKNGKLEGSYTKTFLKEIIVKQQQKINRLEQRLISWNIKHGRSTNNI